MVFTPGLMSRNGYGLFGQETRASINEGLEVFVQWLRGDHHGAAGEVKRAPLSSQDVFCRDN